jgi:hypothetical protein
MWQVKGDDGCIHIRRSFYWECLAILIFNFYISDIFTGKNVP